MQMGEKTKKVIDIIQWVLIALLLGLCLYQYHRVDLLGKNNDKDEKGIAKNNSYARIYDSQTLENLKKENRELYDSIKNLQNVKQAIQVKWKYKYITKEIPSEEFNVKEDSIYEYVQQTDTVDCIMRIKAKDLVWAQANVTVKDGFTIVSTKLADDKNRIDIFHGGSTTIDGVNAFSPKEKGFTKFVKRFSVGPTFGVGYGLQHKQVDVFVGGAVTYRIW